MPPPVLPPTRQLRLLLRTAREAAARAGELVSSRAGPRSRAMKRKGPGDFVTAVDLAAERFLRRFLLERHPETGFLGEEGEPLRLDADLVWVVDPIDGTSNFARGLHPHAVSVACLHRGLPVVAALACRPEGALYSAAATLGAFRDGRRVRMPAGRCDDGAIFGCQWHRAQMRLPFLARIQRDGARIRNFGCTVVQLCDLAMGRLDANLQEQGRIWDIAAAGLLVQEAGGRFTDWKGRPVFPFRSLPGDHTPTLAASPRVHRRVLALLAGGGSDATSLR